MIFTSTCGIGPPRVSALSCTLSSGRVICATGEHSVWPKTMVKGAPRVSSSRVTRAAGTVEPPAQMARTDDRSVCAKRGCSSIAISMVGTPSMALPR